MLVRNTIEILKSLVFNSQDIQNVLPAFRLEIISINIYILIRIMKYLKSLVFNSQDIENLLPIFRIKYINFPPDYESYAGL